MFDALSLKSLNSDILLAQDEEEGAAGVGDLEPTVLLSVFPSLKLFFPLLYLLPSLPSTWLVFSHPVHAQLVVKLLTECLYQPCRNYVESAPLALFIAVHESSPAFQAMTFLF